MTLSSGDCIELCNAAGDGEVTWEFGPSLVSEAFVRGLEQDAVLSPGVARAPLVGEVVPRPLEGEIVVLAAFFEAGLRFPCVGLLREVLELYSLELPIMSVDALVHVSSFEWMLRMNDSAGTGRSFAALHYAVYQPELRRVPSSDNEEGEAHLMYGCVSFAPKAVEAYPPDAGTGSWGDWMRSWFYCAVPDGLRSSGGHLMLWVDPVSAPGSGDIGTSLLASLVAKRQGVRELVEEFLMLGIAPLGQGWAPALGEEVDGLCPMTSPAHLGKFFF